MPNENIPLDDGKTQLSLRMRLAWRAWFDCLPAEKRDEILRKEFEAGVPREKRRAWAEAAAEAV